MQKSARLGIALLSCLVTSLPATARTTHYCFGLRPRMDHIVMVDDSIIFSNLQTSRFGTLSFTSNQHGVFTIRRVGQPSSGFSIDGGSLRELESSFYTLSLLWTPAASTDSEEPVEIELRYANRPITPATWEEATPVPGFVANSLEHESQLVVIRGVEPGMSYYVATGFRDVESGEFMVSPSVTVTTPEYGTLGGPEDPPQ